MIELLKEIVPQAPKNANDLGTAFCINMKDVARDHFFSFYSCPGLLLPFYLSRPGSSLPDTELFLLPLIYYSLREAHT